MSPEAKATDCSAASIQETVQQILAAEVLPTIVQAGHPVLRQVAAPFDGQLDAAELGQLIDLMRSVMHKAPGVGLATALETVFPPVPSEVVLPLAGYTASQGHYGLVAAIIWATVGSLVGAVVLYWLGALWGAERLEAQR